MSSHVEDDRWKVWWDARQKALEAILGPADPVVFHAVIPLSLGGNADVLRFHPPDMGVTYVTSDLIGEDSQLQNELGNYELMICVRSDENWAVNLIKQLARYTLKALVRPWQTMDIGSALPKGSALTSLAFVPHATFKVRGRNCGLVLCLGITADELQAYHKHGRDYVLDRLKTKSVFPFSDLRRSSVVSG